VPLGAYASSSIALLWAINSVVAIAQNALFGSPRVRAALGLPLMPDAAPPAAAAAGAGGGSAPQSWLAQLMGTATGSSSGGAAKPAAGQPPPPGSKAAVRPGVAVSYVPLKPGSKRRKGRAL
jgi:hypothetical protein